MKKHFKASIIPCVILSLMAISVYIGVRIERARLNVMHDNTRNYKYEHYCDSIWVTNPDYYLDVLIETVEYQNYIELHGEWWKN